MRTIENTLEYGFGLFFDQGELRLRFENEVRVIPLSNGDVGDLWSSIEVNERKLVINYTQEDSDSEPTLLVYEFDKTDIGSIDSDSAVELVCTTISGDSKNYFKN